MEAINQKIDQAIDKATEPVRWAGDRAEEGVESVIDWATSGCSLPNPEFFSGGFNLLYGFFKVDSGVVLLVSGTAADVTGIGALLGVPAQTYGAYQIVTGGARAYRRTGQTERAFNDPMVKKSPLHFVEDLLLGIAPGGGSITNFLGGLP